MLLLLGLWNWLTSLQLLDARDVVAQEVRQPMMGAGAYSAVSCAALGRMGQSFTDGIFMLLLLGVCTSQQSELSRF